MFSIFKLSWLGQSFLAMALLVPTWLSINFFARNFNIKGEILLFWYMWGVIIGTGASFLFRRLAVADVIPHRLSVIAMLMLGLTFGAALNILLFSAVAQAPNPGVPIAISNVASVLVFISAALLAVWLPKYFSNIAFSPQHFLGVLLAVLGVVLITLKK